MNIKQQLSKEGVPFLAATHNEVAIVCPGCHFTPPGGPQATFHINLETGNGKCQRKECFEQFDYERLCEILKLKPNTKEYNAEIATETKRHYESTAKKPISLKDLMSMEFPKEEFLVKGLIPEVGLTIISGDGGSFKSTIAMHIAVQVASGKDVFDRYETKEKAVLILDKDNGPRQLKNIFKRITNQFDLPVHFLINPLGKIDEFWAQKIIGEMKNKNAGLVIIDSLFRFSDADENSPKEVSKFMDILKLFKDAGLSCIVLHHNRKDTSKSSNVSKDMRGTSVFRDAVDSHINVERNNFTHLKSAFVLIGRKSEIQETLILTQTKNKNSRELEPFELLIKDNNSLIDFVWGPNKATKNKRTQIMDIAIKQLTSGPKPRTEIILACESIAGESTVDATLKEMKKVDLIEMKKGPEKNSAIYSLKPVS